MICKSSNEILIIGFNCHALSASIEACTNSPGFFQVVTTAVYKAVNPFQVLKHHNYFIAFRQGSFS